MPLLILFPFLKLVTGRVWVYIALTAVAASFAGGWYVHGKFADAKLVRAVNEARTKEHDALNAGNQAEHGYLSRLRQQRDSANVKLNALRKRLAGAPACPVPVPVEWLRDDKRVPEAAPDASGARPAGEDLVTADARDVVLNCERNRLEVHGPNAEQIEAIRSWYRELMLQYNR